MADILPPNTTVRRTDFVRRARVHLSCSGCGTTTITCDIEDADFYEAGLGEHDCWSSDLSERAAYRALLKRMAGIA